MRKYITSAAWQLYWYVSVNSYRLFRDGDISGKNLHLPNSWMKISLLEIHNLIVAHLKPALLEMKW